MKKLVEVFEKTFDDRNFSRSERQAVRQLIAEANLSKRERDFLRSKIFDIARNELKDFSEQQILDWLENANKLLLGDTEVKASRNEVYFSPGDECLNAILSELRNATSTIQICVFTISDNRIARELLYCHRKRISIRIISDDDKTLDMGSDVQELSKAGIQVKIDRTRHHMHHKFAVIDKKTAITGSYNWTRSAEAYNHENVLITDDSNVVNAYLKEFENLWKNTSDFKDY